MAFLILIWQEVGWEDSRDHLATARFPTQPLLMPREGRVLLLLGEGGWPGSPYVISTVLGRGRGGGIGDFYRSVKGEGKAPSLAGSDCAPLGCLRAPWYSLARQRYRFSTASSLAGWERDHAFSVVFGWKNGYCLNIFCLSGRSLSSFFGWRKQDFLGAFPFFFFFFFFLFFSFFFFFFFCVHTKNKKQSNIGRKEGIFRSKLRHIAWETQIQEALESCSPVLQTRAAYIGKTHKVTVSYVSYLSRIRIGTANSKDAVKQ